MLALVAGTGDLPTRVASRLKKWPIVASLDSCPPDELIPEITFRLETLGTFLRQLADAGASEVCFAGAITRPKLDPQKLDQATAPLAATIMGALQSGDDNALRAVLTIFEAAGFKIRGASEFLKEFLPPVGCLTTKTPTDRHGKDIARGLDVLNTLSALDVGQAVAVSAGQVLSVEGIGGTDWMLQSLQARTARFPKGGVLIKTVKQGQDTRVDMPTIGPDTMQMVKDAGLDGICVTQGNVMILDPDATIAQANSLDLFVDVIAGDA